MTDPEQDPSVADALRDAEPPTPSFELAMAAARHRRLVRAAPVGVLALALVIGSGIAAVQQGGEDAAESIVADTPTPSTQETESPAPTVSSMRTSVPPRPNPTSVTPASASPTRPTESAPPTPDRIQETTSATPAVERTTDPPLPPDLPADQLLTVTAAPDLATAAPGNQVRLNVTIHNISRQVLYLSPSGDCGQGFGSVTAQGLGFGPGGDACGIFSGNTIEPGQTQTLPAYTLVQDDEVTRRVAIEVEAVFSQTKQADRADVAAFDKRVTGATTLQLQDAATGTRTFTLDNDTDAPISTYCPCTPITPSRGVTLAPGKSVEVTSSEFGSFIVSSRNGSPRDSCINVAALPRGDAATVVDASSAGPCPA